MIAQKTRLEVHRVKGLDSELIGKTLPDSFSRVVRRGWPETSYELGRAILQLQRAKKREFNERQLSVSLSGRRRKYGERNNY